MSRTTPVTSRLPNDCDIADNNRGEMSTVFEDSQLSVADEPPVRESTPRAAQGRSRERSMQTRKRRSPDVDQDGWPGSDDRADFDTCADARSDLPGRRLLHARSDRRRSSERPRRDHDDAAGYMQRRPGRVQSSPPTHGRPSTLRLADFDGRTHLQTFLLKYFNAKRHNNWSDEEGTAHLRNALISEASCILWSLPTDCDEKTLIDALQARFGTQRQADNLKYQFKARRQGKNESVDEYYAAILKLAHMAYPEQDGNLVQSLICDQFIEGVYDGHIRMKLLEGNFKNIHTACQFAMRLETIAESCGTDKRYARAVNVKPEVDLLALNVSRLEACLDRLTASVESLTRCQSELARKTSESSNRQAADDRPTVTGKSSFTARNHGGGKSRRCYGCDAADHILRNCPNRNKTSTANVVAAKAQQVDSMYGGQQYVNGRLIKSNKSVKVKYIFDSGSASTIILCEICLYSFAAFLD